ncbi:hypothetical protein K505DRAFT_333086 [Melanomma pulvis-pyrius CBS 109.77]|uniref:Uncharacterized protein n=1 Tax=Melanomma pulvis-pyrius CBS 109.77 TaxID=1314802 RepID=A0A6A6XSY8_9PLEO|nr:hypothetical protein K505DRAFT_333086 [Melanomma pulvis-pyrius CBS 109.77]
MESKSKPHGELMYDTFQALDQKMEKVLSGLDAVDALLSSSNAVEGGEFDAIMMNLVVAIESLEHDIREAGEAVQAIPEEGMSGMLEVAGTPHIEARLEARQDLKILRAFLKKAEETARVTGRIARGKLGEAEGGGEACFLAAATCQQKPKNPTLQIVAPILQSHNRTTMTSQQDNPQALASILVALDAQSANIVTCLLHIEKIYELCEDSENCNALAHRNYTVGMQYIEEDLRKMRKNVEKVTVKGLLAMYEAEGTLEHGDKERVQWKVERLRETLHRFERQIEKVKEWVERDARKRDRST